VKEAASDPARQSVRVEGLEPMARNGRQSAVSGSGAHEKVASVMEKWADGRRAINRLAARVPEAVANAGPAPQQPMMPGRKTERQKLESPGREHGEKIQDSLNAVNVLNQYNASRFSDSVADIEEAKNAVAELLYRTRTGDVDTIEENVVKEGLTALDSIIDGLKELQAVN
jgi:hypothetical protein